MLTLIRGTVSSQKVTLPFHATPHEPIGEGGSQEWEASFPRLFYDTISIS
jgi:hypothetical protein